MAANPEVTQIGAKALGPNQAVVVGRVTDARKTEKGWVTIIASPAPDSYSHPGQHEVWSESKLGTPGEDVRVRCQLSGYRRSYKDRNGETVYTVDNKLAAVRD